MMGCGTAARTSEYRHERARRRKYLKDCTISASGLRDTKVVHGLLRRKGFQYAQQTKRELWKECFDYCFQFANPIRNDADD